MSLHLSAASLSVCLSARISQKTRRPNFTKLHVPPVAVPGSSCGGNAVRYVIQVLWMTSCLHIMKRMDQNQRRRVF